MAFKYFILLALALPAVLAASTVKAGDDDQACDDTKTLAITEGLTKFTTCLRDLLNNNNNSNTRLCNTIEDARNLKLPVMSAAADCKKPEKNIEMALDLLISMMNISVQNKAILTQQRVACISESVKELKQCVRDEIPGQAWLADNLGNKDALSTEIMNLNFQISELKKGQNLKNCVSQIWSKKTECSDISRISNMLFDLAFKYIPNSDMTVPTVPSTTDTAIPHDKASADREIARSLLIIASILLVL